MMQCDVTVIITSEVPQFLLVGACGHVALQAYVVSQGTYISQVCMADIPA
jgi:hypothetical protein